jgi:hypothetical protein
MWADSGVGLGSKKSWQRHETFAQPNFPLRVFITAGLASKMASATWFVRWGAALERQARHLRMTADLKATLPWVLFVGLSGTAFASTTTPAPPKHHHPQAAAHGKTVHSTGHVRHVKTRRKPRSAKSIARSRKLQRAFVASSQLRPMAQELVTMRSPAAYTGVTAYAHAHTGEAASAAYLALGHAY